MANGKRVEGMERRGGRGEEERCEGRRRCEGKGKKIRSNLDPVNRGGDDGRDL